MVLKNEQLTAIQNVYIGVCVRLPTGYPSLVAINATRDIGPKQPRRLACFASKVNKLVAYFASSSERQKRQRYFKAILLHREVVYFPQIFPLTASYISLYGKCNGSLRACANSGYQMLLSDFQAPG